MSETVLPKIQFDAMQERINLLQKTIADMQIKYFTLSEMYDSLSQNYLYACDWQRELHQEIEDLKGKIRTHKRSNKVKEK